MTGRATVASVAGRRVTEVLADMGLRTVLLDHEISIESALTVDVPVDVDLDDWEAAEAALRAQHSRTPLTAVLSVRDSHVPLASYLAARLGVRGLALHAALNCANKARMRRVLDGAGLANARFVVVADPAQVESAAAALGYPLVVKVVRGAGGAGVRFCRDAAELARAVSMLAESRPGVELLLEEYLDGPEYAVQTVTVDGRTEVVSVLAEHLGPPPRFVETGYDYPAGLAPDAEQELRDYVSSTLAALGFDNGIAHVQLRLVAGVPKLVEVNPRPPGGRLDELNEAVSGVDMVAAAVSAAMGRDLQRGPATAPYARYRCVVFDEGGVVDYDVAALDQPATAEGVPPPVVSMDVDPGDLVLPVDDPDGGVYGRVLVFGRDPAELDEQMDRVRESMRLRVETPVPTSGGLEGWWGG